MIKLLLALVINIACFGQVAYECTIEQEINASILAVSVFIKSTGVDSFKIGGANFRMNVDTSALDISIAPIELAEGLWDNDYDPTNYGDQGVGFNLLQGWVSIDIFGEGTGDGVTVPDVETLVGTIAIPIKTFNGTTGIKWRLGVLNSTEVIDVELSDITSLGTFIDPDDFILTGFETTTIPIEFKLYQNYPNPFNPTTTIRYSLPVKSQVTLVVYNTLGEKVNQLVNEEKEAGRYKVEFDATTLPSGIYFYRIQAGSPSTGSGQSFVETKKLVLLK